MEDVEECGIPNSRVYSAAPSTSTRSSIAKTLEEPDDDEATVHECLWKCEWQPNPFHKRTLQWISKWTERFKKDSDTTITLMTSPQERGVQYIIL